MALCNNNSYTRTEYTYDSAVTDYSIVFDHYQLTDIEVAVYDADTGVWTTLDRNTAWSFSSNNTSITFVVPPADQQVFIIYRCTDINPLPANFTAGDSIKAQDLNDNFKALQYAIEDTKEQTLNKTVPTLDGDLSLNNHSLKGVLQVKPISNVQGEIRLFCKHDENDHNDAPHYASLKAPRASDFNNGNLTFRIPSSYPTTDGQVLASDTSGVTSWVNSLQSVVDDTTPQLGGDLDLNNKQLTGKLIVSDSSDQGTIRLNCDQDTNHWVELKAPGHNQFTATEPNLTFKLPATSGNPGDVLQTNGDVNNDGVIATSWTDGGLTRAQVTATTLIFS